MSEPASPSQPFKLLVGENTTVAGALLEVGRRLESMEGTVAAGFNSVHSRLDALEPKVSALEPLVAANTEKLRGWRAFLSEYGPKTAKVAGLVIGSGAVSTALAAQWPAWAALLAAVGKALTGVPQ